MLTVVYNDDKNNYFICWPYTNIIRLIIITYGFNMFSYEDLLLIAYI